MADLSKILQQESQGIMFPFRTGVQSTTTEQQVYNSATDGIMTVEGKQYTGPTATVQYGTAEEGYPRMLREIEQGELPQFDQTQFPEVGTGIMEYSAGATPVPVDTTPVEEQPKINPCPAGYELINGVCQPIQKKDTGRDTPVYTGPKISAEGVIEGAEYESVLNRAEGAIGPLNSAKMLELEKKYGPELISKIGEINNKYANRGVQIKEESDAEINRLKTIYGQERIDQDYTYSNGKYYRVVATSPTLSELAGDAGRAIADIIEGVVEKGPIVLSIVKDVSEKFTKYFTKEEQKGIETTEVTKETTQEKQPVLTVEDFGGIDKISNTATTFANNFGILQNNIVTNQEKLNSLFNSLNTIESDLQKARAKRDSTGVQNLQGKREALKNEIQSTKGKISVNKAQSEREEKELQNTINNSIATTTKIGNQTIIQHKDSSGKVVGYSTPDKPNVVNVAGMPPVGPGQRIKSSGGGNNNKSTGTGYSGNKTTGTTGGGILRGGI